MGGAVGASASEDGLSESQPADEDPAEPATHVNGPADVSDTADADAGTSSPPVSASEEAPETEDVDEAEDGTATRWDRIRQPVLRLPGIAKIAQRRQDERVFTKWEEASVRFSSGKILKTTRPPGYRPKSRR
jgi:hypothetical protein